MERKIKGDTFTGTRNAGERDYEKAHRAVARRAAADGMVLLKNEGHMLPFAPDARLAVYGAGAYATVKGGTGSGDVNARETVSIYAGLKAAGFEIADEQWFRSYEAIYRKAREAWRDAIFAEIDERIAAGEEHPQFEAYAAHQFALPAGDMPEPVEADAAIYVISRVAGEGRDREMRPGDYLLGDEEHEALRILCSQHENVLVAINSGGLIDLSFMDEFPQVRALIHMGQPGMEAGNAFADIVSGVVTPSAKLADSWPYRYEDYPNAATFSHMDGDTDTELYGEGIYVGYRYFDTFEVPVRYSFGYGLSYTDFSLRLVHIGFTGQNTDKAAIRIKVEVTNAGAVKGREVVQIYASCPQKNMAKEYRRLAGFAKTGEILPGKYENVDIEIPVYALASYSERVAGWVMDRGTYGFFMGSSLADAEFAASVELTKDVLLQKTVNICPPQKELHELECPQERVFAHRAAWHALVCKNPAIVVPAEMLLRGLAEGYGKEDGRIPQELWEEADALSEDQLVGMVTGDTSGGAAMVGASGMSVPGAASQTIACEDRGIASIVLADGPAGLRLTKEYYVKDGKRLQMPFMASMEDGYLYDGPLPDGEKYYQYCTAFPTGAQLAQSWDPGLVAEVGEAVSEELREFHVTLWLAPGMNIHRNPLCGRNFEYYSEDPLLSGHMAAAMTEGVQRHGHVGTTLKHFACNNQEDNRTGSDSVVSERALREIYLKGFEIAIKAARPLALMTSYNLVNGVHAANNHDLCTKVVRDEWGFRGVIMTDWLTTCNGDDCTASGCMRAGNDLVMPGLPQDQDDIKKALADGTLELKDVKRAVAHLLPVVFQSDAYEA